MKQNYSREEVGLLIQQLDAANNARVAFQATDRPFSVHKETLDLGSARPRTQALRIGSKFRSLFVEAATDVNTNARIILGANELYQQDVPLVYNAGIELDYPVDEAWIYWPTAQVGKTMTIDFFVSAAYRSGQQISVSGGGVSVSEGTAISAPALVTLAAATAAIIAPANTSRKVSTIQNNTGGTLYVAGTSTVTDSGATAGIGYPAGSIFQTRNTGALYGYSVAGGAVNRVDET